jgi:hypothetical protein
MNQKQLFQAQVKTTLAPELEVDGFKQSGLTFRRVVGEVAQVVNLQSSRDGSQFCVCLGIHLLFLPVAGISALGDPQSITEPECEFRRRLAPQGQNDFWWPCGPIGDESSQSVVSVLNLYREQGKPYFAKFSEFPADFTRVTTATAEADYLDLFPPCSTEVRRDLALARINQKLGNTDAAHFFANRGLARVGPAVALKSAFRSLLRSPLD